MPFYKEQGEEVDGNEAPKAGLSLQLVEVLFEPTI